MWFTKLNSKVNLNRFYVFNRSNIDFDEELFKIDSYGDFEQYYKIMILIKFYLNTF